MINNKQNISLKLSGFTLRLYRYILIVFFICLPFSHAPSYKGPYFTLPFMCVLFLVLFCLYSLILNRKVILSFSERIFFALVSILVLYIFILSMIYPNEKKVFSYAFIYSWFPVSIFFFCYVAKRVFLPLQTVKRVLFFGLAICFFYNLYEIYSLFTSNDFFNVPRYDRIDYRFNSPFGYRVRGFNYESANYAFYLNAVFLFLYTNIIKACSRLFALLLWVFLLLLTFSSFHLVFFFLFILPFVFLYELRKLGFGFAFTFAIAGSILTFVVMSRFSVQFASIFEVGVGKIVSYFSGVGYESGEMRHSLLNNAFFLIGQSPFIGQGLSSFYRFQDTGFNNFFLQVIQQIGVLGGFLYISVLLYPFLMFSRYSVKNFLFFILVFLCLWFTADFWLPQILFVYLIVVVRFNDVRLENA